MGLIAPRRSDKMKMEIDAVIFNLNRAKLMIRDGNEEHLQKFLKNAIDHLTKVIKA